MGQRRVAPFPAAARPNPRLGGRAQGIEDVSSNGHRRKPPVRPLRWQSPKPCPRGGSVRHTSHDLPGFQADAYDGWRCPLCPRVGNPRQRWVRWGRDTGSPRADFSSLVRVDATPSRERPHLEMARPSRAVRLRTSGELSPYPSLPRVSNPRAQRAPPSIAPIGQFLRHFMRCIPT